LCRAAERNLLSGSRAANRRQTPSKEKLPSLEVPHASTNRLHAPGVGLLKIGLTSDWRLDGIDMWFSSLYARPLCFGKNGKGNSLAS
jgi:hypothetical protein